MKKKFLSVATASVLAVSMLAGCGGDNGNNASSSAPADSSSAAAASSSAAAPADSSSAAGMSWIYPPSFTLPCSAGIFLPSTGFRLC